MHPPDPLRLCTEEGCSYKGRHFANCSECFGWGVRTPHDQIFKELIPLVADDLCRVSDGKLNGRNEVSPCPACHSTAAGAPRMAIFNELAQDDKNERIQHIMPVFKGEHSNMTGEPCWCGPKVETVHGKDGTIVGVLVIHHRPT